MANAPYEDFLNNWICHAHAVGVQHFVVLTPDAEIATRLEARGIAHHVFVPSFALSNRTTVNAQLNYGTVEYQQLILERTLLVQRMLRLGVNVIIADIDAVWLSDPSAHFHAAHHSHHAIPSTKLLLADVKLSSQFLTGIPVSQ